MITDKILNRIIDNGILFYDVDAPRRTLTKKLLDLVESKTVLTGWIQKRIKYARFMNCEPIISTKVKKVYTSCDINFPIEYEVDLDLAPRYIKNECAFGPEDQEIAIFESEDGYCIGSF
ncbi:MAG: hypothetical protein ACHQ1D_00370 [Nitrososphaerales archaeon]